MKKIIVLCLLLTPLVWAATNKTGEHQHLVFQNHFHKPEEVIEYYCNRDASGFVWSGLLEVERKAFTLWQSIPQNDSFYIAKDFRIHSAVVSGSNAKVQVDYSVIAVGDAHGSRTPPFSPIYSVTFELKRVGGSWKIQSPHPSEIAPVVLEDKFRV